MRKSAKCSLKNPGLIAFIRIESIKTLFYWTSNKLKCVYLLVFEFEHIIFGFEGTDIE